MALPIEHWKNPRGTIACNFEGNDIEYATHGALQSMHVLAHLDMLPSDLSQLTVLDYGCGTGRIARPLTALFKTVYAYDPVPECIAWGLQECSHLPFHNLVMTSDLTQIPEVDVAFSVNVIEHLTDPDAEIMIANLQRLVRGPTIMWHSLYKNRKVLQSHSGYTTPDVVGNRKIHISRMRFRASP
jgi:2-polyprenyl-3-methyl-5-hydroxy-6-metoxy-1,4-benzoquinol methylase